MYQKKNEGVPMNRIKPFTLAWVPFTLAWVRYAMAGAWMVQISAAAEPSPSPNVIFILVDDLNDSIENMGGHPQAYTPNLNRLMERSVRFDHAHANAVLCGPSRASLLTGLYPHTIGYYGWGQNPAGRSGHLETFERPILKDCTTFIQSFARNGYTVFGTGKISHEYHRDAWLFDNEDGKRRWAFSPVTQGPNPSDGFVMPNGLLRAARAPEYTPEPLARVRRFYAPLSRVPDVPADPGRGAPGYRGWIEWGRPFHYEDEESRDLMTDEKSARYAVEVLQKQHDRPFFLAVGFCKPHAPLVAPKKYFDLFREVEIELPPYLENDLEDCAKALYGNTVGERVFNAVRDSGPGIWQEYIRAYLACVAFIDDLTGQILDALEESPYADNTIVIFTSDHGYHHGQKDMIWKGTLWKESTRIPLLVQVPGREHGGVRSAPVSLIDLYPTLVDYCGLPVPAQGLDGYSLRPLLEDPSGGRWAGPDTALTAWMGPPAQEQRDDPYIPADQERQSFSIVSERYRYIRAHTDEEELYDYQSDPHEWHNQAGNPEYREVLGKMRKQMERQLSSVPRKEM